MKFVPARLVVYDPIMEDGTIMSEVCLEVDQLSVSFAKHLTEEDIQEAKRKLIHTVIKAMQSIQVYSEKEWLQLLKEMKDQSSNSYH